MHHIYNNHLFFHNLNIILSTQMLIFVDERHIHVQGDVWHYLTGNVQESWLHSKLCKFWKLSKQLQTKLSQWLVYFDIWYLPNPNSTLLQTFLHRVIHYVLQFLFRHIWIWLTYAHDMIFWMEVSHNYNRFCLSP